MRVWIFAALVLAMVGCDAPSKGGAGGGSAATGGSASSASVAVAPVAAAKADAASEVKLQLKNFEEFQALVASKKGKVVVVDTWSTYCQPCMDAFPGLVDLHKKYGVEKIACISLCANYAGIGKPEDEIEGPLEFLKQKGATFDNVLSTVEDEKLYKLLKIASVPCIFIYDADGNLVKTFNNETKYSVVEEVVKPLLK